MILMGGHRPLTASASLRPFIEPGMSISVKTTVMSRRASRRMIASSALAVSMTSKPASSIMLTVLVRTRVSSSTMRTTFFLHRIPPSESHFQSLVIPKARRHLTAVCPQCDRNRRASKRYGSSSLNLAADAAGADSDSGPGEVGINLSSLIGDGDSVERLAP
jgi:hypothetical protein